MANKKRLIDADALMKTVLGHFGVDLAYLGQDLQFCQEAIQFAPTIDAVEVVHGEWEKFYHPSGTHGIRCKRCKVQNGRRSNYCPNCGADMRERKDNG